MTERETNFFEEAYFEKYYIDYYRQNPIRKIAFYRSLVESVTREIERPRLLEVGCGFGLFLEALDCKWEPYGVDISSFAIQKAKERARQARVKLWDGKHFPIEGNFDVIVSFDVLEHVLDLDSIASTICSILAPDGHFIFVVPVYDGPTAPIIKLLDRDESHVHKQGKDFWLKWVASRFTLMDWLGIYRLLIGRRYYLHIPTKRFRRLTPAIAVTAQKRAAL